MLRNKRKFAINKIKDACRIVVLIVTVLFLINRTFFHIAVPNARGAFDAFGVGFRPYTALSGNETAVYFLDTGQSDCSLIMTGTHNVLIDCGDLDSGYIVTGALNALGVERLDYVVLSHPHVDHFGGLIDLCGEIPVGTILMPYVPDDMIPRTFNYSKLLAALDIAGVRCEYVRSGDAFPLGNSVLEIAAPLYNDYSELNDLSVAARFVHGENAFLFTGDMEKASERDLAESGAQIGAEVLKVSHHGSAGSSCEEFLKSVSPKIAVVEAGIYNTYGHPRSAVIDRLRDTGCEKFCATSLNGNIAVISDGEDLRIECEKAPPIILKAIANRPDYVRPSQARIASHSGTLIVADHFSAD